LTRSDCTPSAGRFAKGRLLDSGTFLCSFSSVNKMSPIPNMKGRGEAGSEFLFRLGDSKPPAVVFVTWRENRRQSSSGVEVDRRGGCTERSSFLLSKFPSWFLCSFSSVKVWRGNRVRGLRVKVERGGVCNSSAGKIPSWWCDVVTSETLAPLCCCCTLKKVPGDHPVDGN